MSTGSVRLQATVAGVCLLACAGIAMWGSRDTRNLVTTGAIAARYLVTDSDIARTRPGTPSRTLLEWFQAVQRRQLGRVHALTAPLAYTDIPLALFDRVVIERGAALAYPRLISVQIGRVRARVRTVLVTVDPAAPGGQISFPWTFALVRSGGRWLMAGGSVLFPGGHPPPAPKPAPANF